LSLKGSVVREIEHVGDGEAVNALVSVDLLGAPSAAASAAATRPLIAQLILAGERQESRPMRLAGKRGETGLDIVERAKAIVLRPAAEWRVIETESGDAGYLFTNYVAILAAIPPIAAFIRRAIIGAQGPRFGGHARFGFFSSLFGAVIHYLVAFVVVYAMAMIIDALRRLSWPGKTKRTL
jgi:hypothetical protein